MDLELIRSLVGDYTLRKKYGKYSLTLPLNHPKPIAQILNFQFLNCLIMPLNNYEEFIALVNCLETKQYLKILDISNSTFITHDLIQNQQEQFKLTKTAFEKLHTVNCCIDELNLSNCNNIQTVPKAVILLITSSKNIKTLNLSNNLLHHVFSHSLQLRFKNDDYDQQMKTSNIENLIINNCLINNNYLECMNNLRIFLDKMPKLHSFNFNNNNISDNLSNICRLICNYSSIRTFTIVRNQSDFRYGIANYESDLNQYITLVQTNPNIINLNFAKNKDQMNDNIKNKLSIISHSIYNNRLRSLLMLILCGKRLKKINRTFPRIPNEVWEQLIMPYLIDYID
jgi:hypothetical protein